MTLQKQQMQSLSKLIEDAETMVELYWDTENGQKLSRSLKAARAAFDDQAYDECDPIQEVQARLIIEAECSTCGPLDAP